MAAKGSNSVLDSSENQDAIRRAAKNKQQVRRRAKGLPTTNLFDEIRKDRQDCRQAAADKRRAFQEEQLCAFVQQALTAADDSAYKTLVAGSVAEKIATAILLNFPTVTPTADKKRLQVALDVAKSKLTAEELSREGAIRKGLATARSALNAAFQPHGEQQVPGPRTSSE